MRPIDADALKKDLTRFYDNEVTARELIDEQPTADVQPVKHGRLIRKHNAFPQRYFCTECGGGDVGRFAFCHHCGARMRMDGENE